MPAPYSGQCLCGGVALTVKSEPVTVLSCFCVHCSKGAGGCNQLRLAQGEGILQDLWCSPLTVPGSAKGVNLLIRTSLLGSGLAELKPKSEIFVKNRPDPRRCECFRDSPTHPPLSAEQIPTPPPFPSEAQARKSELSDEKYSTKQITKQRPPGVTHKLASTPTFLSLPLLFRRASELQRRSITSLSRFTPAPSIISDTGSIIHSGLIPPDCSRKANAWPPPFFLTAFSSLPVFLDMPDSTQSPIREPRPKRQKIDIACDTCRARKVKCNGVRPACGNCLKRSDLVCHYSEGPPDRSSSKQSPSVNGPRSLPRRHDSPHMSLVTSPRPLPAPPVPPGPHHHHTPSVHTKSIPSPILRRPDTKPPPGPSPASIAGDSTAASVPSSAAQPSPSVIDSMTIVLEDGESTQQYFGSSSAGSFTRQIKAAIDARLGVPTQQPPPRSSSLLSQGAGYDVPDAKGSDGPLDYVLPPRRQADHLTGVYWFYVDPLYPFLDKAKWDRAYEGLFTGGPIDVNERIFVTTLNVIFALATQLVESLHPEQRDDSSNIYFRRAQDLLRLNLWDAGSFEVVQCLLLMSQYLQSTNNPHQTWMVVGSAIRTAQSLGLHLPETTADMTDLEQREMLRRICNDFGASGLGCTSSSLLAQRGFPQRRRPGNSGDFSKIAFFTKSVELYEIINSITQAFYSDHHAPRSRTASRKSSKQDMHQGTSTPSHDSMEEDLGTVMKLDEALTQWEHTLPDHIRIKVIKESDSEIFMRQAVILRIRSLQARLLLLRPTLSRFCLQPAPSTSSRGCDNLRNRVVKECASFCVATAQRLLSLMTQYQTDDGTVGLLPAWWYRVYYIYSAATILIATKLRPDFFPGRDSPLLGRSHGLSARSREIRPVCPAVHRGADDPVLENYAGGRSCGSGAGRGRGRQRGPMDAEGAGVAADAELQAAQQQMFEEFGEYPNMNLGGLSFDAGICRF
ncbi:unnamed protein product [Parascedosporium putredinis]|uniref:Zn(2)-C6 fungal-type domain-containing protein n=1 Tax=Parascedosporium putredinis TaxID=1442378 RepID=A0A9P1M8W6_9PEZI|nr:unnamed protein product [Parascedosporium putredinis]CAI7993537.1 unnamed protein product [Parascedosporium putredinis]